MEWSLLYSESATHWQEYRDCYPDDPQIQTIRSTDLSYVSGYSELTKKYSNKTLEECCKQAVALNKQKYTFIKNTIAVVADDLGEAGYHHPTSAKKEPVRGGYVMPPEASSIDTLLSRSKALADQIREGADE